ncbi:MAG TPA: response regulator transcription factor [Armatimonadota bacterium]|nr:response regulator transcription factor [Armatimonadota bacterium]
MAWSETPTTDLVIITERERQEPILTLLDQLRRLGFGIHIVPRTTYQHTKNVPTPQVVLVDSGSREFTSSANLITAIQAVWEYVPIILLARADEVSRIRFGPSLHDFITLPTTPVELDTRIRFALWKTQGTRATNKDLLQFDGLRMNLATYEVWIDNRHIDLTYKEFELLKFFISHRKRVFTRTELLDQVWEHDYFGGTRTVDVHIRRLRAKLGLRVGNMIQTVRNVGYRFG